MKPKPTFQELLAKEVEKAVAEYNKQLWSWILAALFLLGILILLL